MSFPLEGLDSTLSVLLFRDVKNSKELRQKVIAAEVEPEFAFINAAAVLALLPLQLAAHKALAFQRRGKLVTKTLHSELVFNLSGSRHIGESLKRFGVQEDTAALLVARYDATPQDLEYVRGLVVGREVPLTELGEVADAGAAAKVFKVAKEELAVGSVEDAVACRIAVRDCL
ncbi:MAG: kinase binding protein CGI-121-domain-containing protein [Monoraphidium minutum]|nr:MAG: kinase binding protein CGI-121-domain-containing protein [Monoraphidium minutum]